MKKRMEDIKPSEILGIEDPKKILYCVRQWTSDVPEREHIIKSVVQEIHQNCEIKIDRIIYKLLVYCSPQGETEEEVDKTKNEVWSQIGRMGFEQKYRLLKPILKNWKQQDPGVLEVDNINKVRNQCTHVKIKEQVEYKGHKIFSDPEGIARLFLDAWGINKALDEIWEWIDDSHAYMEKAVKFARKNKGI